LITKFRERVSDPGVQSRVSDKIMEDIYDQVWKAQREKRANRSFLRMFWSYQDGVGDDNYLTFKIQEQNKRINVRPNIKTK